jgi:ADP-heptose:LPS heptosyltransferase
VLKVSLTLPGSSHFTILITQMGGLGDLILSARLISSLRANFPEATLVLVCREAFAPVCNLFPTQPDRVISLTFSPYDWAVPSEELYAALTPVMDSFQGLRADLFIAGEYQPTWFNWYLAARLKPQRAIQATHAGRPRNILPGVLEHFELERVELDGPKCPRDLEEAARYAEIIRFLGGTPAESQNWVYPEELDDDIQDTLHKFGLRSGEYLVCFPLGAPGVSVKRWPKDRFSEVIRSVRAKSPMPVLFTGETSEHAVLAGLADQLGGDAVHVYTGGSSTIPELAGLILHARAYLGNDTGPLHIASAYGIGGVAIYGGGHWPAYGPWGQGSVAMVHPLPCFGCNWDCLFGHGVCVESVAVGPVVAALERVLAGEVDEPETDYLETLPAQSLKLIQDANSRYREAEEDRGERLYSIVELRRNVDTRDDHLEEMKQIAAERLRALEAQNAAILQLRAESDRRREAMDELTTILDVRDVQIEELETVCSERLTALEKLAADYAELNTQAELRTAGLVEFTNHLAARNARLAQVEHETQERLKALRIVAEALEKERATSQERLSALLATDEALRAVRADSELRLQGMVKLTEIIAARDLRIEELETANAARPEVPAAVAPPEPVPVLEPTVIVDNRETLYHFLTRMAKKYLPSR